MLFAIYILLTTTLLFFGMFIYETHHAHKLIIAFKTYEKEVDKLVQGINTSHKRAELLGSVKERFKEFRKLTDTQKDLLGQINQPSANASHSKFKNTIVRELKDIEEKKKEILESILNDGIDVHISMIDMNGETSKILISKFLKEHSSSSEKTESNIPHKVKGNLRLIKSPSLRLVKGENKDESSSPKVH